MSKGRYFHQGFGIWSSAVLSRKLACGANIMMLDLLPCVIKGAVSTTHGVWAPEQYVPRCLIMVWTLLSPPVPSTSLALPGTWALVQIRGWQLIYFAYGALWSGIAIKQCRGQHDGALVMPAPLSRELAVSPWLGFKCFTRNLSSRADQGLQLSRLCIHMVFDLIKGPCNWRLIGFNCSRNWIGAYKCRGCHDGAFAWGWWCFCLRCVLLPEAEVKCRGCHDGVFAWG